MTSRTRRGVALLVTLALVGVGCGGGDSIDVDTAVPTTEDEPTPTPEPEEPEASDESQPAAPDATVEGEDVVEEEPAGPIEEAGAIEDELPEEIERTDLLTYAQGVLFVDQTGLATGSASGALRAIDGNPLELTLTTDAGGPVELVLKMPAETTFDRFAIPNVVETPGNATFIQSVIVSGSAEGPDTGYQVLAEFDLDTHGPDEMFTEVIPEAPIAVRWVKVDFEDGINIEEGDEGRTNLEFTEIIGNGTQAEQPLSTAFTGIWELRLTERTDLEGEPLELRQEGATISGCYGTMALIGSVNGSIARATGIDSVDGRLGAFIFVADDDGAIQASVSLNGGIFNAFTAVVVPETSTSPCSDEPPTESVCGATAYVNFDVDSSVIRSESAQVLADLYDQITAEGVAPVSIEGHTSTEGTDDYNQDLSERRAQAIVDDLVARGLDPGAISAAGFGETQPLISPDDDEAAREINRRVEIACT